MADVFDWSVAPGPEDRYIHSQAMKAQNWKGSELYELLFDSEPDGVRVCDVMSDEGEGLPSDVTHVGGFVEYDPDTEALRGFVVDLDTGVLYGFNGLAVTSTDYPTWVHANGGGDLAGAVVDVSDAESGEPIYTIPTASGKKVLMPHAGVPIKQKTSWDTTRHGAPWENNLKSGDIISFNSSAGNVIVSLVYRPQDSGTSDSNVVISDSFTLTSGAQTITVKSGIDKPAKLGATLRIWNWTASGYVDIVDGTEVTVSRPNTWGLSDITSADLVRAKSGPPNSPYIDFWGAYLIPGAIGVASAEHGVRISLIPKKSYTDAYISDSTFTARLSDTVDFVAGKKVALQLSAPSSLDTFYFCKDGAKLIDVLDTDDPFLIEEYSKFPRFGLSDISSIDLADLYSVFEDYGSTSGPLGPEQNGFRVWGDDQKCDDTPVSGKIYDLRYQFNLPKSLDRGYLSQVSKHTAAWMPKLEIGRKMVNFCLKNAPSSTADWSILFGGDTGSPGLIYSSATKELVVRGVSICKTILADDSQGQYYDDGTVLSQNGEWKVDPTATLHILCTQKAPVRFYGDPSVEDWWVYINNYTLSALHEQSLSAFVSSVQNSAGSEFNNGGKVSIPDADYGADEGYHMAFSGGCVFTNTTHGDSIVPFDIRFDASTFVEGHQYGFIDRPVELDIERSIRKTLKAKDNVFTINSSIPGNGTFVLYDFTAKASTAVMTNVRMISYHRQGLTDITSANLRLQPRLEVMVPKDDIFTASIRVRVPNFHDLTFEDQEDLYLFYTHRATKFRRVEGMHYKAQKWSVPMNNPDTSNNLKWIQDLNGQTLSHSGGAWVTGDTWIELPKPTDISALRATTHNTWLWEKTTDNGNVWLHKFAGGERYISKNGYYRVDYPLGVGLARARTASHIELLANQPVDLHVFVQVTNFDALQSQMGIHTAGRFWDIAYAGTGNGDYHNPHWKLRS